MSRYPFTSRREVADRLNKDATFVRDSLRLLHERTLAKAGGFMASHRSKAAALIAELDNLSDETVLARGGWIASYARTLARIARDAQLRADPSLAVAAAVFGVVAEPAHVAPARAAPSSPTEPLPEQVDPSKAPHAEPQRQPAVGPERGAPSSEAAAPAQAASAKKRGRPVGSKNRKPAEVLSSRRRTRS